MSSSVNTTNSSCHSTVVTRQSSSATGSKNDGLAEAQKLIKQLGKEWGDAQSSLLADLAQQCKDPKQSKQVASLFFDSYPKCSASTPKGLKLLKKLKKQLDRESFSLVLPHALATPVKLEEILKILVRSEERAAECIEATMNLFGEDLLSASLEPALVIEILMLKKKAFQYWSRTCTYETVAKRALSDGDKATKKLIIQLIKGIDPKLRAPLLELGKQGPNLLQVVLDTMELDLTQQLLDSLSPEEHRLLLLDCEARTLLKGLLRLNPEVRQKLLQPLSSTERARWFGIEGKGKNLLHYAAGDKGLQLVLELMSPEELKRAMGSNERGWTALHYAAESKQLANLQLLVDYAKKTDPKLLTAVTSQGDSILHVAANHPKIFGWLVDNFSGEQLGLYMLPNRDGQSPLFPIFRGWKPVEEILIRLLAKVGRPAFAKAMAPDKSGHNPLITASNRHSLSCLKLLLSTLNDKQVLQAMRPNEKGETALSTSAHSKERNFEHLAELVLKLKGEILQLATATNSRGGSLFHEVVFGEYRKGRLSLCKKLFEAAGRDPVRAAVKANDLGITPLTFLLRYGNKAAYEELLTLVSKEQLAPCLLNEGEFDGLPIYLMAEKMHEAHDLLFFLKTQWQLVDALGSKPIDGYVLDWVHERFPNPLGRVRFFLFKKLVMDDEGVVDPWRFRHKIPDRLRAACEAHNKQSVDSLKPHFKGLLNELARSLEPLCDRIKKEQDDFRLKGLQLQLQQVKKWQRQLCIALTIGGNDGSRLTTLLPMLTRLQSLADADTRHVLTQIIARYPLTDEKTAAWLTPALEAGKAKAAYLDLIPLAALGQKGADPKLLSELHTRIVNKGVQLHEGVARGKILLSGLGTLVTRSSLEGKDLDTLLNQILKGDFYRNIIAVAQVLGIGGEERLKNWFNTGGGNPLQELSTQLFQEVIPVGNIDNFQERYAARIMSRRDYGSLISYASELKSHPGTLLALGRFVGAVLTGKFYTERYSDDKSEHLETLYQSDSQLKSRLTSLCSDIEKYLVTENGLSPVERSFPMDRRVIHTKLISDKHLSEARFPRIFEYLRAKTDADRLKLRNARKMDAKGLENFSPVKRLEFFCQQSLISLCMLSEKVEEERSKKEKANPKTLINIEQAMARELQKLSKTAEELAKGGEGLGDFANDIDGALDTYKNNKVCGGNHFLMSITDDYWDLLRCGTEVNGSCQSLYGSLSQNRCLLAYVMHGKNFALIARKPGEKRMVARRLLRVEIDQATNRPALFLERLYSNYSSKPLEKGFVALAKKVADHLGIPLYSSAEGTPCKGTKLIALEGPVPWTYSDAAFGASDGGYEIDDLCLLHKPQTQLKESDSSSSSSSSSQLVSSSSKDNH